MLLRMHSGDANPEWRAWAPSRRPHPAGATSRAVLRARFRLVRQPPAVLRHDVLQRAGSGEGDPLLRVGERLDEEAAPLRIHDQL